MIVPQSISASFDVWKLYKMKRLENMYVCMTAIQERRMHNQAGFGREGFARMLVMKLYSCV